MKVGPRKRYTRELVASEARDGDINDEKGRGSHFTAVSPAGVPTEPRGSYSSGRSSSSGMKRSAGETERSEPHQSTAAGTERSDQIWKGQHIDDDVVTKSRAIKDTGENPPEPPEMRVHKLEMILAVKQKR